MNCHARKQQIISLLLVIAVIAALPVFVVCYTFWIDWRYVNPWEKIERGDSEERVIALLGRPHYIVDKHLEKVAWESARKIDYFDANCVKQFRYAPPSITGEEYDIGFDSNGHAVAKYHITSP